MKTYDAGGQVCSITGERDGKPYTYVADIRYDEYGQRVYIKYGNGVETNYTYDENMRWLKHIGTENKYGTQYQNIVYSFDDVGNVLGYKNDCMNGARYSTKQEYTYDALYQLISATGTTEDNPYAIPNSPDYTSTYNQDFSFDAIGNMTRKDSKETITPAKRKSGGDDLNYDLTYEYDTNYAHRLTRAGSEQKGWRYYTYDANGNVTSESDGIAPNEDTTTLTPVTVTTHTNEEGESVYEADYAWAWPWSDDNNNGSKPSPRNKRIYEWNSRNLLMRSIALGYDTRYAYAADGNRAAKWTAGNLSETLYFNTMWTWHIEKGLSQEQQGQYSKHIYLGETRIVTKQTSDLEEYYGPSEEKRHQYYYHPDHLGSAQLVTDYEGNEYQRIEYTPYGELWVEKKTANEKDMRYLPYKFTAKEMDEETGLYYYGARYLDAKYSRWLSADPAVGEYMSGSSAGGGIYDSINFNLYHYAGNNPIKYTDPTGMWKNNEDGTFTAEKDDTLWGLYGKDWKEKSGYEGDPTKLQIGDTVGKKNDNTTSSSSDYFNPSPIIRGVYDKYGNFLGYGIEGEERKAALEQSPTLDVSLSISGSLGIIQGSIGAETSTDYSGHSEPNLFKSVDIGVSTPGIGLVASIGMSFPKNKGKRNNVMNFCLFGFGSSFGLSEKGITSFNLFVTSGAGNKGDSDKSDMGTTYTLWKK